MEDMESLVVKSLQELCERGNLLDGLSLGPDTPLFGRSGVLDSVGLVSLVVAVEQAIEDKFGVSVSLADEKALSQQRSPYRTVRSLAEYARSAIQTNA